MRIARRSIKSLDPKDSGHYVLNDHMADVAAAFADRAYATMYNNDNPVTINVATTGTIYKVTNMASGNKVVGFEFSAPNDELTCKSKGTYLAIWSLSLYGAQGRDIEGIIGVNGAEQEDTGNHADMPQANARTSVGGQGLVQLAHDDTVQLYIHSHDTTGNITIEHANVTLVKIDT